MDRLNPRAVAQTLWLMKIAKKLTILTVENGNVEIKPEELQSYLTEHDIKADIIMVKPSGTTGASLMQPARAGG